jgi:outer membrane protein OmpA-like peptidoglycan-associated protein
MRNSYAAAIVFASCVAIALPTAQLLAQTPTQQDLEKALRPIPKALSGGHQGVTAGAVSRFPTEQNVPKTSYTAPAFGGGTAERQTGSTSPARHHASSRAAAPSSGACGLPTPVAEPGTVSLPQITFEFNSMTLTPEAKETLRALGSALNAGLKDYKFVLQGHTDAVGSADYNMDLSRKRAEAARDFLINEMKVDPDRLQVVGKGFTELANPCHPRAAENRRLVVINQSQS